MEEHGSYGAPAHLDALIHAAVEDLRKDGCTHFVIYGQCWGAWKALEAAADSTMPFLATGGPHPSRMSEALMRAARCPIILLPAKDDDDMVNLPLQSLFGKSCPGDSFFVVSVQPTFY